MNGTIIALLCLASAPMALMPGSLALFTRHPNALPIIIVNLAVWLGFLAGLAAGVAGSVPLIVVALVAWLILFRLSISARRPRS